jgi:hypothetical protein
MPSVRALEDLRIQSIYDGLVKAKLDQQVTHKLNPIMGGGG